MYCEWSRPDLATYYSCYAVKVAVRTADNPTIAQAQASDKWILEWEPAVNEEMNMLAPEDLHCYTEVLRRDIPAGAQIQHSKMDLKTK